MFREYDLREDGSVLMGQFFTPEPLVGLDPDERVGELSAQLSSRGQVVEWSDAGPVAQLLEALGTPLWVGITPEREGVRLVLPVRDAAALSNVETILAAHGISPEVVARLGLFAPVVGGPGIRLAVDAVEDSLGSRVGFEITGQRALRLVPGLLDALGISGDVVADVEAVALDAEDKVRIDHIPGVQTDEHSRSISHVKVTFEASGDVSVKTYVAFRNMPLAVGGRSVEDVEIPPTWEFHDLLFHSRSRNGRVRDKLGGTARFSIVPEMATFSAQPMPGDVLLPPVDVAEEVASDVPFGQVLRSRVSDRDWSGPEVPMERLSKLLARVMEVIPREVDFEGLINTFDGQPYPSGGGIYEVDVVVVAHRVSGLEPGAYLYRRGAHSLEPLEGDAADIDQLLFGAAEATGNGVVRPQALLVLAARFPDLAVKYQGIAYALMLKHVGVLQATIAYTAAAMGLGAVPIGTGDSDAFARASGLDYYVHGSIGEIAISEPPLS
ncbi:MAG TPA: SagB family peptide dehydrogenase, partial [Acidimicrobiia bacterium]